MTASSTRTRKTTTRARAKRNEACEDRLKSARYREGIRDNSQTRADHRCSLELRPLPASLARSLFPVAFPFFSFAHETNELLLFLLSSSSPSSLPSSILLFLFSRLFQSRSRDPIHRPGTVRVPSSTRMSPRNHEPRARRRYRNANARTSRDTAYFYWQVVNEATSTGGCVYSRGKRTRGASSVAYGV